MMQRINVAHAIAAAMEAVEEDQMREQYRAAIRVLQEIPSGTPDSELTKEQRDAWRAHDEARNWLARREVHDG